MNFLFVVNNPKDWPLEMHGVTVVPARTYMNGRRIPVQLEHLLTFTALIGENTPIGGGPYGHRSIAAVSGGTFEGPTLRGTIQPPGADWVLVDANGRGRIDVRLIFGTDDGANIYVTYTGVLELNEAISKGPRGQK